jgi:hypothetical protein
VISAARPLVDPEVGTTSLEVGAGCSVDEATLVDGRPAERTWAVDLKENLDLGLEIDRAFDNDSSRATTLY